MTHWTALTDNQLRVRLAAALGPWYWPAVAQVETLLRHRRSEPHWSTIDALLNRDQAIAA